MPERVVAMNISVIDWISQHLGPGLVTLSLLGLLYLRDAEQRADIRSSLLMALGVLLLASTLQLLHPFVTLPLPANVVQEVVTIATGLVVLRMWGLISFYLLLPLAKVRPPRIVNDIVMVLCYVGWGFVRLHLAGMDLGQIVTTSAVITGIIAFSMQDTLGNLLAGVAIQLDNSIHVGDWVQVDTVGGRVVEINWRATSIETRNWETVVVPNSQLLKSRFMVLGKRRNAPQQWRRWVWFELTLDTLPNQIITLVEAAMHETDIPGVSKEPPPSCVLMKIEQGLGHYAVRYWLTDLPNDDGTDSKVRALIDAALRRHDRRLSPPIFNILMTKEHEQLDARHKRHTAERMARLRSLPLFAMLGEDELVQLADQLKFTPFVNGDIMLRQGEVPEWLFIIASGEAEMFATTPAGKAITLGMLKSGNFFGETGLLTGEPYPYSVRARGNVECYRVNQDMFQQVFLQREELVDELSRALEARMEEQQHIAELMDQEAPPPSGEILSKLRALFGLQ